MSSTKNSNTNWGLLLAGNNMSLKQNLHYARLVTEAGAESVWAPELGRDPFLSLASVAHNVDSMRLGTAVAQFARSPLFMANAGMDMAGIAQETGNDFVLGVGTAPPDWNKNWHDLEVKKPVTRMREYLAAVRSIWEARPDMPVSFEGEFVRIKDYVPMFAPPCTPPKVLLAAVGPNMLSLAGECADGMIGNILNTPEYFTDFAIPKVREAQEKVGRTDKEFEVATLKICVPHKDPKFVIDCVSPTIAFYANLPYFDSVLDPAGFEDQKLQIRDCWRANDLAGACAAVSDDMVKALTLSGTPDQVREQAEKFVGIVDTLILFVPSSNLTIEQTIELHDGMALAFKNW